jgi:HTH-type transcriptional repressor of NAD biosynthesis genes
MRRGLVFGKYQPLHRGHQFVIDRALAECDEVAIVVYDNHPPGDYPPMPIEKRVKWLQMLYPHVETIVGVMDPMGDTGDDDPTAAETYAAQLRPLGKFDRVFTSEPQYEAFALLLGARHVLVDPDRTSVPISGTQIRSNLYDYRGYLDPRVYATLIEKVVFVGTESTGKSTLARLMAEKYDTLWVHEFGRELWESQDLQGSFADHLRTARRQYDREWAMARNARRYLFCDTNAWTTLMWSINTYGFADSRLKDLVAQSVNEYIWILCDNDFEWVQDGTRELEGKKSTDFQRLQVAFLRAMEIPYYAVHGTIENRVSQVEGILSGRLRSLVGSSA